MRYMYEGLPAGRKKALLDIGPLWYITGRNILEG